MLIYSLINTVDNRSNNSFKQNLEKNIYNKLKTLVQKLVSGLLNFVYRFSAIAFGAGNTRRPFWSDKATTTFQRGRQSAVNLTGSVDFGKDPRRPRRAWKSSGARGPWKAIFSRFTRLPGLTDQTINAG